MPSSIFWQSIPGLALDVSVGADGSVFIVSTQGQLQRWTGAAFATVSQAQARRVAAGPRGEVYVIDDKNQLSRIEFTPLDESADADAVPRRLTTDATQTTLGVPGGARDVGVGPKGTVWAVAADSSIYRFDGAAAVHVSGQGSRITVGPGEQAVIIDGSSGISASDGSGGWMAYPGLPGLPGLYDLGVNAAGALAMVTLDGQVVLWDPKACVATLDSRRGARAISLAPDGLAWVVQADGTLLRQVAVAADAQLAENVLASQFVPLPDRGLDLAVSPDGNTWMIGTNNCPYELRGYSWAQVSGANALRISVGPNNTPYKVAKDIVWRRDGNDWNAVGQPAGGALDVAAGPLGGLYCVSNDKYIHRWDGSSFVRLPSGQALRIALGPGDRVYIVGTNGQVFELVGDTWTLINSAVNFAADVAVGVDGTLWVAGQDRTAYRFDRLRGCFVPAPIQALSVAVGPNGWLWAVKPDSSMARQASSALPGASRNFIRSLWWRYLGREPSESELTVDHDALLYRLKTREEKEREFLHRAESQQRSGYDASNFLISLCCRYLNRLPDAPGFDFHYQRLYNGTSRAALEEEFRTCEEARRVGVVSDRLFVLGLFLRYLGRFPPEPELGYHIGRLSGSPLLTRQQLEIEFRGCDEAQRYARPLARDFVLSLCARYIPRMPSEPEVSYHTDRLASGKIAREAMEEEFRTCTEGQAYDRALAPLQILCAAYTGMPAGQEDVTSLVGSWVRENQLWSWWRPEDFPGFTSGDGGEVLVIVYRYGQGPVRTITAPVGSYVFITPRIEERLQSDPRSLPAASTEMPTLLTILGAAYGRSEVTLRARGKVRDNLLPTTVNATEWGSSGPTGSKGTLTVVYQVGSGAPILQVARDGQFICIGAPPLLILGACYGVCDVTGAVAAKARGGRLELVVNDSQLIPSNPNSQAGAALLVAYRYGEGPVLYKLAAYRAAMKISPELHPLSAFLPQPLRPAVGLNILAAAYGLRDVTGRARELAADDSLMVVASDSCWEGDSLGSSPTVGIIFQIDGGRPLVRTAAVGQLSFLFVYAPIILGAVYGTLDVTDKVATLMRAGCQSLTVDTATLGDPAPGADKRLVIAYQYKDGQPRIAMANCYATFSWFMHDFLVHPLGTEPTGEPRVLAATYGPRDVTMAARRLVHTREREFLLSLYWRYLGHGADGSFELHWERLQSGGITRAALEQEFATCNEARAYGPVTDRSYVFSLYWRHLGRDPDAVGLSHYLGHLADGTMTREQCDSAIANSPEANEHRSKQLRVHADDATWGASSRPDDCVLLLIYENPDVSAMPQILVLSPGEEDLLPSPERPDAYLEAEQRLLTDLHPASPPIVQVRAPDLVIPNDSPIPGLRPDGTAAVPDVVVPSGGQAPELGPGGSIPVLRRKNLIEIVLKPRLTSGGPLPSGAQVELTSEEDLDLFSDQSGRLTCYRMTAGAPLKLQVPSSGRCRFCIEAVDAQLVYPLLRARWNAMPQGCYAIVAPDRVLHEQISSLEEADLLCPPSGKLSPVAAVGDALAASRARQLKSTVIPVLSQLANYDLHLVAASGETRRARPFDLRRAVPAPGAFVPPHIHLPTHWVARRFTLNLFTNSTLTFYVFNWVSLRRSLITGAGLLGRTRYQLKRSLTEDGIARFSLFSAIKDAFSAVKDAFASLGQHIVSGFRVVIKGIEVALDFTAEGMQSFARVVEQAADSVATFTDDTYAKSKSLLIDAANGLVAYSLQLVDGAVQVVKTAITTVVDAVRLATAFMTRMALQVKQFIEFLLLFLNWGDVVETQRYLAWAVNEELERLPIFLRSSADDVRGVSAEVVGLLPGKHSPARRSTSALGSLPVLGGAWGFLYDRLENLLGGALPGLSLDTLVTAWNGIDPAALLADFTDVSISLPATNPLQLVTDSDAVLGVLTEPAAVALGHLSRRIESYLKLGAAAADALRAVLNVRLYVPVLTELIELLILGGEQLTLLSLITLLAGAAYNFTYKSLKLSATGPTRGAPPPIPSVALSYAPAQVAVLDLPVPAVLGLMMTQAVSQLIAALVGKAGGPLSIFSALLSIPLGLASASSMGKYWPSEAINNLADLGGTILDLIAGQTPEGKKATTALSGVVSLTAIVTGAGLINDKLEPLEMSWLRMGMQLANGLYGLSGGKLSELKLLSAVYGVGLAIDNVGRN